MNGGVMVQMVVIAGLLLAALRFRVLPFGMQVQTNPPAPTAKPVSQIVDEETDEDLEKMSEADLLRKFEQDSGTKPSPAEKKADEQPTPDPNKPAQKDTPPEIRYDPETGELVITEEVDLTAEEKAAQLAEEAKNKNKPPATEEEKQKQAKEARLSEAVNKLQVQFDTLAKEYPELAEALPKDIAGEGVKGLLTRYNELTRKVNEQEQIRVNPRESRSAANVKLDAEALRYVDAKARELVIARGLPKGVTALPATDDEWDKLHDDFPGAASRLERQLESVRREVEENVREVVQVQSTAELRNEEVLQADLKQIQKEAKAAGIDVTQKEFVEYARTLMADPDTAAEIADTRYGVPIIRRQALLKAWRHDNHEKILQGIVATKVTAARRETVESLQNLKPQAVVLGATAPGQGRVKRERRIKLDDDAALEKLSEAELMNIYDRRKQ